MARKEQNIFLQYPKTSLFFALGLASAISYGVYEEVLNNKYDLYVEDFVGEREMYRFDANGEDFYGNDADYNCNAYVLDTLGVLDNVVTYDPSNGGTIGRWVESDEMWTYLNHAAKFEQKRSVDIFDGYQSPEGDMYLSVKQGADLKENDVVVLYKNEPSGEKTILHTVLVNDREAGGSVINEAYLQGLSDNEINQMNTENQVVFGSDRFTFVGKLGNGPLVELSMQGLNELNNEYYYPAIGESHISFAVYRPKTDN